MLYFCQALGRFDHAPQTVVIELIGESAGRAAGKHGSDGDHLIFFSNILMNCIVGETCKRKPSAGEQNLNLIGRGEFPETIKDVSGFLASYHLEFLFFSLALW